MALDPILWSMKDAPVADTEEWAVLSVYAEHADEDGCNAFPSHATIAERTKLHERTVADRVKAMEERGLLARGDQNVIAIRAPRIPANRRPVLYDLMIPADWWGGGSLARVNQYRSNIGLPALTAEDRPPLPPAPPKKKRKDAGTRRGATAAEAVTQGDEDARDTSFRGESESGVTTTHPYVEVGADPAGVSSSARQGALAVPPGVTATQTTHPPTNPHDPPRSDDSLRSASAAAPIEPSPQPLLVAVPDEPSVTVRAQTLVRAWVDWHAGRAPIPSKQRVFLALVKTYVAPALEAGYTEDQVKAALRACGDVQPPMPQWRRELAAAAGATPTGGPSRPSTTDERVGGWLAQAQQAATGSDGPRALPGAL